MTPAIQTTLTPALDIFLAEVQAILQARQGEQLLVYPAIQQTLTTATRHWFGDAQGKGARTFRGVTLEQFRTVRSLPAVREAEMCLATMALTGYVPGTQAVCQKLTEVYKWALTGERAKIDAALYNLTRVYEQAMKQAQDEAQEVAA